MVLSELGKLTRNEWRNIETLRKSVELDLFVVMPNHLHGILFVKDDLYSLGNAPSQKQTIKRKRTLEAGSLGAIISQFKAGVTRRARASQINCDAKIWQRNYYDRIVRDEDSLNQIRQYIMANPSRWREDSLYVEERLRGKGQLGDPRIAPTRPLECQGFREKSQAHES